MGELSRIKELRRQSSQRRGTAEAAGIAEPPEDVAGAERWIKKYNVGDCLEHSIRRLLPWLGNGRGPSIANAHPNVTIRQCLDGEFFGRAARHAESLRSAARAYLWYCAGRKLAHDNRLRLWNRKLEHPAPRSLSRLLRQRLDKMLTLSGVDVPVVFGEAPIALRRDPPALEIRFSRPPTQTSDTITIITELDLCAIDRGQLELNCSCSIGESSVCPHGRVLLEWALDILHDTSDPLHHDLVDIVCQPGWTRLVGSLKLWNGEIHREILEGEQELVWRLGGQGCDLVIQPVLRTRTKAGGWRRGRALSAAVCLEEYLEQISPKDRLLLATLALVERSDSDQRRRALLSSGIETLLGHPRVFSLEAPTRSMTVEQVRPVVTFVHSGDWYRLAIRLGGRLVQGEDLPRYRLDKHHIVLVDEAEGRCFVAAVSPRIAGLLSALERLRVDLPPESHPPLIDELSRYQPDVELDVPLELRGKTQEASTRITLHLTPRRNGGLEASLRVKPADDFGPIWPPGEGPEVVYAHSGGQRISVHRDLAAERRSALPLLDELGLDKTSPVGAFTWYLEVRDEALDLVATALSLGNNLPIAWPETTEPWQISDVSMSQLIVKVRRAGKSNKGRKAGKASKASQEDTRRIGAMAVKNDAEKLGGLGEIRFSVEGWATLPTEKISLDDMLAATRGGSRYFEMSPSTFAHLDGGLRDYLKALDVILLTQGRRGIVLGSAHADRASELLSRLDSSEVDDSFRDLCARVDETLELVPEPPPALLNQLRPYQVDGFRWLARMAHRETGCCLADDLGLGKTLQAIAIILSRSNSGPTLVVAPTAVGTRWALDLQRFAPSLRLLTLREPLQTPMIRQLGPNDVLIVSYSQLALDIELLESRRFATVVFDEGHMLKGPQALRTRAACRVRASFRLVMANSHVDGDLEELWSLFHPVNPDLLGPWEHFASRFVVPIEQEVNEERRASLTRMINPFVLRRRKAQVAAELSSQTEVVFPVELTQDERRWYEATRRTTLESLAADRKATEDSRRRTLLSTLTRLRLLACHPRLIDPDSALPSSKVAAALKLLDQYHQGERSTLIVSQFTSHIALLRESLDLRHLKYGCLDHGTTPRSRSRLVERWQLGQDQLLLLSLEAKAPRLNLTGADTVIHLDPVWPGTFGVKTGAAQGRKALHRPLTVIQMIAQGTLEEAILDLHNRQAELAEGIIAGSQDVEATIDIDELRALIEWSDEERLDTDTFKLPHAPPTPPLNDRAEVAETSPAQVSTKKRKKVDTPSLQLEAGKFPDVIARFLDHLKDERRRGLLRTDTTLAVYRRSAKRFENFVALVALEEGEHQTHALDEWGERYLEALRQKSFEAPHSEPSMARTVLRRLTRFLSTTRSSERSS